MGRKPAPQPLALSDPAALGDGETRRVYSPSASKSPGSPRSPFRFPLKKSSQTQLRQSQQTTGEPLQATGGPQHHHRRPQHQHNPETSQRERDGAAAGLSSPSLVDRSRSSVERQQQDGPTSYHDGGKPSRSGFFFGFTKSKTSLHQHSDSQTDLTMSRGSDNPAIPSKAPKQSGTCVSGVPTENFKSHCLPAKRCSQLHSTGVP